jgi:hypothetical protein
LDNHKGATDRNVCSTNHLQKKLSATIASAYERKSFQFSIFPTRTYPFCQGQRNGVLSFFGLLQEPLTAKEVLMERGGVSLSHSLISSGILETRFLQSRKEAGYPAV